MSFLSVIMPVYNAEKYIRQTVSSVLGQSFSDLELICIDDCSTDGSFSVLKDIERTEPRLHVFRTEKNSGAGSARNLGLEKASSEYISFESFIISIVFSACSVSISSLEIISVRTYKVSVSVTNSSNVILLSSSNLVRTLI